jgi:malonyl-CoA/methylmalonyl-CoA synthetase
MSVLPLLPAVAAGSEKRALEVDGEGASYADLHAFAARLSAELDARGVAPGARILVWAERDLVSLMGLVGGLLSGRVLVPVNPEIGERELGHVLHNAAPALVFASRPEAVEPRVGALPVCSLHTLRGAAARTTLPALAPDAACLVLYTSGTTGLPKGALLSPANIAATLDGLREAWQLSDADTLVHALPVFHAHGLVFGLLGALRLGATLLFVPKFSPEAIARALGAGGRVMYAVPTMYHRLLDAAESDSAVRAALAGAKLLVSGSAALPARVHGRIEQLTGQRVAERYGLSETLINTAARADGPRLPGTVGTPLPGVTVLLVDDARVPHPGADPARIGEVAVRGPNVFAGYLGNPAATAEVKDAAGFFYTGDLGTLDHDGTLRIVGRKATDLIKTGGFKVGAGEVENALLEHADVAEVAVVGAPDADLGERIEAYVVPRAKDAPPSADALSELVARLAGKHKRPRVVHFVESLPRNAMGKVQKKLLITPPKA